MGWIENSKEIPMEEGLKRLISPIIHIYELIN